MSVAVSISGTDMDSVPTLKPFGAHRPLHRLAAVRQQEGLSRRTVARHLGVTPGQVQEEEQECNDLPLSKLYAWQQVLNVPIGDLLVEGEGELSVPIMQRAQLLRIMKTVRTILERSKQMSIRRMAQVLSDQLEELMPELKEVGSWPSVGQRRNSRELGQAAQRRLSQEALIELERDVF